MPRLLVVVTLDLHGVPKAKKWSIYTRVRAGLERMGLRKTIWSKRRADVLKLPFNTYAGHFVLGKRFANAAALRDHLTNEIKQLLNVMRLRATVFVAVGASWAWGKRAT